MTNVLCTRWIPGECEAEYGDVFQFICPEKEGGSFTREELLELMPRADILFSIAGTPVTRDMIDRGSSPEHGRVGQGSSPEHGRGVGQGSSPEQGSGIGQGRGLKIIASLGVGYDHVDVEYAAEKRIPVVNSPTQVTEPTAEHTIALVMGIFHNLYRYTAQVRAGIWNTSAFGTTQTSVSGHVLGIVGMGRIGQCVGKKAAALGMKVLYYDPLRLAEEKERENGFEYGSLAEVLEKSDCVTLHVPYTGENRHMFGREAFARMKQGAYFVNASRGGLVDTAALADALRSGRLKGAALDVFEKEPYTTGELAGLDQVILTPHVASETWDARMNMARECLDGARELLLGNRPANVVNPQVLEYVDKGRETGEE